MRYLLFSLLSVTFSLSATLHSSPGVASSVKPVEEYWRASGLNLDDFDLHFNPVKCFEVEVYLVLSCLRGFNAAGKLAQPQVALVARSTRERQPQKYTELVDYGPVILVEIRIVPPLETYASFIRSRDQEDNELKEAAIALHSQNKVMDSKKPFSYSTLFREFILHRVPKKIPLAMAVGTALSAQVNTNDAHSAILPSVVMRDEMAADSTKIVGVGVLLHPSNKGYGIYEVIRGGAADESGKIQARDLILKINGERIDYTFTLEQTIARLIGEENTPVNLVLERNGQEFSVTLYRKRIDVKNVEGSLIPGTQPMGYIKLRSFSQGKPCEDVKGQIEKLTRDGARGFIFDLRNNTGGFVHEAVCIAGLFLGKDKIVVKQLAPNSPPSSLTWEKTKDQEETAAPLVVLINEASASASELVAGALQDYQRAWIVGEKSYGKGTVQDVREFEYDPMGTVQAFTIQIFYQPSGRSNQRDGIFPDFVVPYKANATDEERWAPREVEVYPNTLAVPNNKVWVQTRPEAVKNISGCMSALPNISENGDYQLLQAQKVLACTMDKKVTSSN